jgi:hypothetical protein
MSKGSISKKKKIRRLKEGIRKMRRKKKCFNKAVVVFE